MANVSASRCPNAQLVELPAEAVLTKDKHQLRLGDAAYFRFSPGHASTQYVVVSDQAIKTNGVWKVVVLGERGHIGTINPQDLVVDEAAWKTFRDARN